MEKFLSYAQNFEDVMLWRALMHVEAGFYVDVGANDPVVDSVTKAFSCRGWQGINIEPIEHWHAKLVEDRPNDINLQIAASSDNGTMAFFEVIGTGLSTAQAEIAHRHSCEGFEVKNRIVTTLKLSDVFDKHDVSTVHFLKIDVEGGEEDVLRGMDFKKIHPWIVLIEATDPKSTTPSFEKWEHHLLGNGYSFIYFDGLNRYYLSNSHPELRAAFEVPPNISDNFVQYSQWIVQQQLIDELTRCQQNFARVITSLTWRMTKPLRAPINVLGLFLRLFK